MAGEEPSEILPLGLLAPIAERPWRGEGLAAQIDQVPVEIREQVANYLAGCPVIHAWMEYTRDVIDDRFGVSGGSAIHSDGSYYWRGDAAEYVRVYGVSVPGEALATIRRRAWKPPQFSDRQLMELFSKLSFLLP